MPFDEQGKYFYQGGETISGFLWRVTTDTEEYFYYTSDETYPELPQGHYAEPLGDGMIAVEALRNATIKDGVVHTYSGDILRQVEALKVLLKPE